MGRGGLLTDIHSPDALAQPAGKGKEKGQCPEEPLVHTAKVKGEALMLSTGPGKAPLSGSPGSVYGFWRQIAWLSSPH